MSVKIIITGPSGSGKTSLEDAILGHYSHVRPMRIMTTRELRPEDDIARYSRMTLEEISGEKDAIIYGALVPNMVYATVPRESEDEIISVIPVTATIKLRDNLILKGHTVYIVYIESSVNDRIQAMLDRGETNEKITARIMSELMDSPVSLLDPHYIKDDYDYKVDFNSAFSAISECLEES